MANASGFFTHPTISALRSRTHVPFRVSGSGFCVSKGFSRRVYCSSVSSIDGVDKQASPSPSEYRRPRLVPSGCKLIGSGSAVPSLLISNDDLAKIVDTNDEWIATRTGIRNRRVVSEVSPEDIDLVLMCTSTPDDLFGAAPQVVVLELFLYLGSLIGLIEGLAFYSAIRNRNWRISKLIGALCCGFLDSEAGSIRTCNNVQREKDNEKKEKLSKLQILDSLINKKEPLDEMEIALKAMIMKQVLL